MSQNILSDSCETQAIGHLKIKLSYMTRQKERVQIVANELQTKVQILQNLNQELIAQKSGQNDKLYILTQKRNRLLQEQYMRILNENTLLSSSLLLSEQIIDQNHLQSSSIIKNYQQKIIELRRLIQSKQSFIQNLQAKLKINEETIVTPASNVTLLFFNEIEQLKKTIQTLSLKIKDLQQTNAGQNAKNNKLQSRLSLLQSLTSNSKIMFDEFKLYYLQKKNQRHSAPKKDIVIPLQARLNQQIQKRNKQLQSRSTRQFSEYLPNKDSQNECIMKKLIYKASLQNQKTKSLLKKAYQEIKFIQKSKTSLLRSYQKQQQILQKNIEELNYYKNSTLNLMKLISCRRDQIKSRSLEKSKIFTIIENIKPPVQMNFITQRKAFWLNHQNNIKIDKINLIKIKKKYKNCLRSFSCIIDYKQMQNDKIDALLNKKLNNKIKAKDVNDNEKLLDFTQMIKDPFGMDFSIIQTSPAKKVTYSQWKKHNGKNSFNNLTIINQNIL